MKKIVATAIVIGMVSTFSIVSAQESAVVEPPVVEEATGWKKAGKEIGEAAGAVVDATADSSRKAWKVTKEGSAKAWDATKDGSKEAWDATKKGSREVWNATKEKSKSVWEKSKEKIYDVTAPEPAKLKGD